MNNYFLELGTLVATVIIGILGGSFGTALLQRKLDRTRADKIEIDAESVEVGNHLKVAQRAMEFNRDLLSRVEALERAMAKLSEEVRHLEEENAQLRDRCRKLERENAALRREIEADIEGITGKPSKGS